MLSTYGTGILQAKAYRTLRQYLSLQLEAHELTMAQWACLGLIFDGKALRLADIAHILDVEPPFATALADQLEKKGLVIREASKTDRRAKSILLTDKGSQLIPVIEKEIKDAMRKIYTYITPEELGTYVKVLQAITLAYE